MDEADPRIELRIAGKSLFDARHADQHEADVIAIEKVAQLLEAGHTQPVGFVDQDQLHRCQLRARQCCGRDRLRRCRGWRRAHPVNNQQFLKTMLIFGSLFRHQRRVLYATFGLVAQQAESGAKLRNIVLDSAGAVHDLRGVQDGIGGGEGGEGFVIGTPDRGQSLGTLSQPA